MKSAGLLCWNLLFKINKHKINNTLETLLSQRYLKWSRHLFRTFLFPLSETKCVIGWSSLFQSQMLMLVIKIIMQTSIILNAAHPSQLWKHHDRGDYRLPHIWSQQPNLSPTHTHPHPNPPSPLQHPLYPTSRRSHADMCACPTSLT